MLFPWQLPVILRVLAANVIAPVLIKRAADRPLRIPRLFIQYCFGIALAVSFALLRGQFVVDAITLIIVGIGVLNGIAASFFWQAIRISLSRNALATFLDDVIAMALAYIILTEGRFLNTWLITGGALALGAAISWSVRAWQKSRNDPLSSRLELRFFFFVILYSIIWGGALFLMRYFGAVRGIPLGTFLLGWYGGSFISLTALLFFAEGRNAFKTLRGFKGRELLELFALSATVIIALALAYWSFVLAPQTIVQPIYLVAEMLLPALVGLYYFKELKKLDWFERFLFGIGGLGALIILLGF